MRGGEGGEGGEGQGRPSNLFSTIILEPRHLKRIRCRGGGREGERPGGDVR